MTILGPCVEKQPRTLKLIFTQDPAKPASLTLEMYSLGHFENLPSSGFILIFNPGPKESNRKVLHESLKMTILRTCVEIPPRRLKLIFTPDLAKPASLKLGMYSLGLFKNPPSRGFISIFTSSPKKIE